MMIDPKEVLELCKKATPGWRRGNIAGTIVTDAIDENVFGDDSNREYYGGSLVGESIHSANRDFAILARNVLPELAQRVLKLDKEVEVALGRINELAAVAEAAEKATTNATDTLRNVNGNFIVECWNIEPEDMDDLMIALAAAGYGGEE